MLDTIHLHNPNVQAFEAFATDNDWAGQPFWMLNTFRFKTGAVAAEANRLYSEHMRDILRGVGGRLMYRAPVARTLIGEKAWEAVAIVEYPSPEAFLAMATSEALAQASTARIASFADQFLIPISAGWMPAVYRQESIGATTGTIVLWTTTAVDTTPNALIGAHHTKMGPARAVDFIRDDRFTPATGRVWMLNLLQYAPEGGKDVYRAYTQGLGDSFPGGSLMAQFGLRVTYAARRTFQSLIGDINWDAVALVEYPSRDHFLSMGGSPAFQELHRGREAGLRQTYLICSQPAVVTTMPPPA